MLHTMARKIAFFFFSKGVIEKDQIEVNAFGLELLLSTLINGILVFLIAMFFGVIWQTLLMMIPFILIRSTAGGFHAKTHAGCATSFVSVYLLGILILKLSQFDFVIIAMSLALLVGVAVILIIGIVPHINRPLGKKELIKFRMQARFLAIILSFVGLIGLYIYPQQFIYFSLGLFIAAGSLLTAWMINKKSERTQKND